MPGVCAKVKPPSSASNNTNEETIRDAEKRKANPTARDKWDIGEDILESAKIVTNSGRIQPIQKTPGDNPGRKSQRQIEIKSFSQG
jgi:hypothetical protein